MPIQSIHTRRVYQQISDQLLKLINAGEFPVDCRLPSERDLAEKFKVSRPSVREALIALEVIGVVQIKMGSGVYVCKPEEGKQKGRRKSELYTKDFAPFELIQARLLIESEIAAQAATCRSDQHIVELEDLLQKMIDSAANNQNPLDPDREFHATLARATGNQVLSSIVEQLFDARMGVLFSRLSNYFDTQTTWKQAIKEHREILHAVKIQNSERARLAMRQHMERAYKRFSASWLKSVQNDQSEFGTIKPALSAKTAKAGKIPG
jgi:DNA-binding FadR family transcriptional regulator